MTDRLSLPINARLVAVGCLPRGGVGAEIGVHLGNFSNVLLRQTAPRRLHLIDPWAYADDKNGIDSLYSGPNVDQTTLDRRFERVRQRFAEEIEAGTVVIHRARSVDAAGAFSDGELDFVYIDGDHSYEGVVADLRTYLPKVRSGGFLAGDDYMLGKWWEDGVIRAFNEFIAEAPVLIEMKLGSQLVLRKR